MASKLINGECRCGYRTKRPLPEGVSTACPVCGATMIEVSWVIRHRARDAGGSSHQVEETFHREAEADRRRRELEHRADNGAVRYLDRRYKFPQMAEGFRAWVALQPPERLAAATKEQYLRESRYWEIYLGEMNPNQPNQSRIKDYPTWRRANRHLSNGHHVYFVCRTCGRDYGYAPEAIPARCPRGHRLRRIEPPPLSASTVNGGLRTLGAIYSWAVDHPETTGVDPAAGYAVRLWIKNSKLPERGRERVLTEEEVDTLLDACYQPATVDPATGRMRRGFGSPELRLAVLIGYWTCLRKGNVHTLHLTRNVHIEDDPKNCCFHVMVKCKGGGKPFRAWMPPDVRAEIEQYLRDRACISPWLFPSINTRTRKVIDLNKPWGAKSKIGFREACRRAHLGDDVCFHTLRHSMATRVAEETGSVLDVQAVLGDSTTSAAMRYIHRSSAAGRRAILRAMKPTLATQLENWKSISEEE